MCIIFIFIDKSRSYLCEHCDSDTLSKKNMQIGSFLQLNRATTYTVASGSATPSADNAVNAI